MRAECGVQPDRVTLPEFGNEDGKYDTAGQGVAAEVRREWRTCGIY